MSIFRQVDAECGWHEPTQVVLYNGAETDVEISALGFDDPHFAVEPIALPYKLAAGDILPLQLDFDANVGSFTGKLSVESSSGCVQFPVRAKGFESGKVGVAIHHPYVIDFGHVAAETLSPPVEFAVLDQPMSGSAKAKLEGFRSSSPSFRIEPQAKPPAAGGCEPVKVTIRLVAPNMPGLVTGQLSWISRDERAEATVVTEMIGVVD
ncbi:MAG TPA: hypothetical protein VJV78_14490 [Polyangiales bacterium]|nr:hypothetical protein [Polyangiales bacterium]